MQLRLKIDCKTQIFIFKQTAYKTPSHAKKLTQKLSNTSPETFKNCEASVTCFYLFIFKLGKIFFKHKHTSICVRFCQVSGYRTQSHRTLISMPCR